MGSRCRAPGRLVVQRLWNALTMMGCIGLVLACGTGAGDRMVREYAECMVDPNTTLH